MLDESVRLNDDLKAKIEEPVRYKEEIEKRKIFHMVLLNVLKRLAEELLKENADSEISYYSL